MDELSVGQLTKNIARAKAMTKVRGPFRVACSACGQYYWPNKQEEHLAVCRPPKTPPIQTKPVRPLRVKLPAGTGKTPVPSKKEMRRRKRAAKKAANFSHVIQSTEGPRPSDKYFLRRRGAKIGDV